MRRILLAASLAVAVSPASAASLSSTVTLASDYLFDGVSQTQGDSTSRYRGQALQASLDLAWESGWYVGTWASNVDFGSFEDPEGSGVFVHDPANIEIDVYGGYAWETAGGLGLDAGVAHYTYTGAPSDGYDYTELYFGVTLTGGTGIKAFVTEDDDVFDGYAWRVKGTHSFALGETYSLDLEATVADYEEGDGYLHGQIGVSREAGPFSLYLGYSDTDQDDNPAAEGRFLFTISSTVEFF